MRKLKIDWDDFDSAVVAPSSEARAYLDLETCCERPRRIGDDAVAARALPGGRAEIRAGCAMRFTPQSPAAGHEQAVLGRRVEWLPDMDSNHD